MLVEVLQNAFPFGQDEFAAEVLPVVSASFPQEALSVACQEESVQSPVAGTQREGTEGDTTGFQTKPSTQTFIWERNSSDAIMSRFILCFVTLPKELPSPLSLGSDGKRHLCFYYT